MIIREDSLGIVRFGDIARIELGPQNPEQAWKYNGVNAVGLAIIPQPGANNIQIADQFNKKLEIIKASNKADLEFNVLIDNTINIRHSLNEVKDTLMIAFALVVLVIFFFFRNWLIAIRPLIDIPISLIATFFIMYAAGFSINILTLLAIVLATGLVVDDGIVVTENIFRKLEEGMPLRKAAVEGSKEIFFAVISTSLTLAVVFMPVVFLRDCRQTVPGSPRGVGSPYLSALFPSRHAAGRMWCLPGGKVTQREIWRSAPTEGAEKAMQNVVGFYASGVVCLESWLSVWYGFSLLNN